jgi:hypothetical protein
MKTNLTRIIGAVFLLLGGAAAAAGDTVLSPTKRQEALERGKALIAPREITPIAVNPFYPTAFTEAVAGMGRVSPGTGTTTPASDGGTETVARVPTGPRTDRDLLQAIATGLKPSGFFTLGGQPTLVFGQKRVKAGGNVTINFEGADYTVEITAITPPNFTLRLNREEFTRTIK